MMTTPRQMYVFVSSVAAIFAVLISFIRSEEAVAGWVVTAYIVLSIVLSLVTYRLTRVPGRITKNIAVPTRLFVLAWALCVVLICVLPLFVGVDTEERVLPLIIAILVTAFFIWMTGVTENVDAIEGLDPIAKKIMTLGKKHDRELGMYALQLGMVASDLRKRGLGCLQDWIYVSSSNLVGPHLERMLR